MNDKDLDIWKEKTKGIFHITEYRRFWNYITNLQEENKELNRMCEIYSKSLYNADLTKAEKRIDKAVDFTNRTIEVIKQQPSGNDEWILGRLNSINYCLNGDDE